MAAHAEEHPTTPLAIFFVFLRLGCTSFGGPVAHLSFFRHEFVDKRRWLSEAAFSDLIALCQFLPGPASSQVAIGLGLVRAGLCGALAAVCGFALPTAVLFLVIAAGAGAGAWSAAAGSVHGLKIAAAAVVAQALWGMSRTLCPDLKRACLALMCAGLAIVLHGACTQVVVIVFAAIAAIVLRFPIQAASGRALAAANSRRCGLLLLSLWLSLLLLLPLAAANIGSIELLLCDSFYRVGSLVFGGGHVVLPLLQAEVVPKGWVSNEVFLAGYGLAQAMPGPLFAFAAYLGAVANPKALGIPGGMLALVSIYMPSFLLVAGTLPFWTTLQKYEPLQRALCGANAAVVGLLLAAFYDPIWTSSINSLADFALGLGLFVALQRFQLAPWLVVAVAALVGAI